MLQNLVKKFRIHSLNEKEDEHFEDNCREKILTRNAFSKMTKNHQTVHNNFIQKTADFAFHDDNNKDSGTESDEELEQIETNSTRSVPISQTSDYYASQQSLSASCRSSHCGSPGLGAFSDQECNSWDNNSLLSVTGDSSTPTTDVDSSSSSNINNSNVVLELPNHHYHTRQQFHRFLKQHQQQQNVFTPESGDEPRPPLDGRSLEPAPVTAFEPVRQLRSDPEIRRKGSHATAGGEGKEEHPEENDLQNEQQETMTPENNRGGSLTSLVGGAAEKRKWSRTRENPVTTTDNIDNAVNNCCLAVSGMMKPSYNTNRVLTSSSSCLSSRRHSFDVCTRSLLTAARKTPVKLLIPPPKGSPTSWESEQLALTAAVEDTMRISPRKKLCRHGQGGEVSDGQRSLHAPAALRPCLNFDKMREKMVKSSSLLSKKKCTAQVSKLKNSTVSYQLRSFGNDCLFQPVCQSATTIDISPMNSPNDASTLGAS